MMKCSFRIVLLFLYLLAWADVRTLAAAGYCLPQNDSMSCTVSPLDPSAIKYIIALGNLNPPQHTFPSDHIYLFHYDPDSGVPHDTTQCYNVYARAACVSARA